MNLWRCIFFVHPCWVTKKQTTITVMCGYQAMFCWLYRFKICKTKFYCSSLKQSWKRIITGLKRDKNLFEYLIDKNCYKIKLSFFLEYRLQLWWIPFNSLQVVCEMVTLYAVNDCQIVASCSWSWSVERHFLNSHKFRLKPIYTWYMTLDQIILEAHSFA